MEEIRILSEVEIALVEAPLIDEPRDWFDAEIPINHEDMVLVYKATKTGMFEFIKHIGLLDGARYAAQLLNMPNVKVWTDQYRSILGKRFDDINIISQSYIFEIIEFNDYIPAIDFPSNIVFMAYKK